MGSRIVGLVAAVFVTVFPIAGCGKSVTKDDYEKIRTGMSKEEVVKILGTPEMQAEAESDMMGTKMEILHYQTNAGLGAKAITITIQGGTVVDKQWTQL